MPPPPEILFEDPDLLALNKPSGWLTEGGDNRETDLEQWATRRAGRPVFCCHRLDRPTSGVVLLRKTARYNAELAALFAEHRVRKLYWAVVEGDWPRQISRVETHIAAVGPGRFANIDASGDTGTTGKPAVSTFRILGHLAAPTRTWLGVLLKTGRTHQARLHCAHVGHSIVGDPLYGHGNETEAKFFGLHARELRFAHPADGESLQLVAPPPDHWPPLE